MGSLKAVVETVETEQEEFARRKVDAERTPAKTGTGP